MDILTKMQIISLLVFLASMLANFLFGTLYLMFIGDFYFLRRIRGFRNAHNHTKEAHPILFTCAFTSGVVSVTFLVFLIILAAVDMIIKLL